MPKLVTPHTLTQNKKHDEEKKSFNDQLALSQLPCTMLEPQKDAVHPAKCTMKLQKKTIMFFLESFLAEEKFKNFRKLPSAFLAQSLYQLS